MSKPSYLDIYNYVFDKIKSHEFAFCILLVIDKTRDAYLYESSNKLYPTVDIPVFITNLQTDLGIKLFYRIENPNAVTPPRYFIYSDTIKHEIDEVKEFNDTLLAKYLKFSHPGIDINTRTCSVRYMIFNNEDVIVEICPQDAIDKYKLEFATKLKSYNCTYKKIFEIDNGVQIQYNCSEILIKDYREMLEGKQFSELFHYKNDITEFYSENYFYKISNQIMSLQTIDEFIRYFEKNFDLLYITIVLNEELPVHLNEEQNNRLIELTDLAESKLLNYYQKTKGGHNKFINFILI